MTVSELQWVALAVGTLFWGGMIAYAILNPWGYKRCPARKDQ